MKAQAVTPTKETVEGDPQPTPNHNGQTGTHDQWQEVLQTENTTRNQTVEAASGLQQVKPRKPKEGPKVTMQGWPELETLQEKKSRRIQQNTGPRSQKSTAHTKIDPCHQNPSEGGIPAHCKQDNTPY